ncbi:DMP19 family protein [Undibacterium sp. Di27W]|uniref:DMP19 family protein n=1 Tax=Undibacterium sp. Di27W TaxID=3413036 RepID=UPI003BF39D9F
MNYLTFTRDIQLNYLIGYFYYQLMNGGLWQYLANPCGVDAPQLVVALEEIGAKETAKIIAESLAFFPDGEPQANHELRWQALSSIPDEIRERLDDHLTTLVNDASSPENLLSLLQSQCAHYKT